MKNYNHYIGKTFKGFAFEHKKHSDLDYDSYMDKFIGEDLKIEKYYENYNCFHTNTSYSYPADLVIAQFEKQETEIETETFKPKRGGKVLVWDSDEEEDAEERIFLTQIEGAEYPYICVEEDSEEDFINGDTFDTTKWKKINPIPKKVIPKDTLVWCKNNEIDVWEQRFYSHFENGKHFCFVGQKKSNKTTETTPWNIVTDKNPFE
jgi:hypothetical protein